MTLSLLAVFLSLVLLSPRFSGIQLPAEALPLSTSSRWIVDESGRRVKLACVNWPSHLDTMVAEGLGKQTLDDISKKIASTGFNCVRLTWALFMATNDSLASVTVRKSFQNLGLLESLAGIQVNNPDLVDLTLLQTFRAVVSNLGDNSIMVILDNHLSKPGWCCSNFDDNGFFGDRYFDPDTWLNGLTRMATMFANATNVVGMSLRNELRGQRQNVPDWYRYMQRGAEAVHAANPSVLVILSGLNFDNDLSFLSNKGVNLSFTGKTVFELHWYGFSDGQAWASGNPNQVCGRVVGNVMRKAGFLLDQGWPLFLSEVGVDQRGGNLNDNRYLGCMVGLAAELDFDWALWALQGSYYLRQGHLGLDEVYGLLGWDWCKLRNSSFLQRISALQSPFQGPGSSDPYTIIFHPSSGLCVTGKSLLGPFALGPCTEPVSWTYDTAQLTLAPSGTLFCLKAAGDGEPAKLGIICGGPDSKWKKISDSKMHIATDDGKGGDGLCLDVGPDGSSVVTSKCRCLSRDSTCNPESQWFKMVNSTRGTGGNKNSLLGLASSLVGWWSMLHW